MATMSRIPLPTIETMTVEQRAVYDAMVASPRGGAGGPLLVALYQPKFASKLQQLGEHVRFNIKMGMRLSELVILTVGRFWNSQFVWYVHETIAQEKGVSLQVIEDIRHGRKPKFTNEDELEVYEYCIELVKTGFVNAEIYNKIVKRWGGDGVVELTGLIGYYCMNSLSINAHELFPEGAPKPLPVL